MSRPDVEASIQLDPPIPPRGKHWARIVRPKSATAIQFTIVSTRWRALYIHYLPQLGTKGRSQPCVGLHNGCAGCLAKVSRRWKAYLGCYDPRKGEYVLAELTPSAILSSRWLKEMTPELRGNYLRLWRGKDHPQGPICAEVQPGPKANRPPADFDLLIALYRIWGIGSGEYLATKTVDPGIAGI